MLRFHVSQIACGVLTLLILIGTTNGYAETVYSGSNTLQLNRYNSSGDKAASPYQSSGSHHENIFSLDARNRLSAYETVNYGFEVTADDSDYRAPDDSGLLVDRLRLRWEKGDGSIPFRLDGGDIFVGFSQLTAEISLKGMQLDLQPRLSSGRQDSIQLFAATQQSDWEQMDLMDNLGFGGSWLLNYGDKGAVAFNLVFNHRQGDDQAQTLDRDQRLLSVAWLKPFGTPSQTFQLEGELALFNGDHDGADGQDRTDHGGFIELQANHKQLPLDYRIKISRYGQDFQPAWANVPADQQSVELYGGWRFASNHKLRLRLLNFRHGLESLNKTRDRTAGFNLAGKLLAGFAGSIDGYQSDAKNADSTTDRQIRSIRLSANRQLWQGIQLNSGLSWLSNDDKTATDSDSIYRQANVGLTFAVDAYGWRGRIAPSVRVRDNKLSNDSEEVITQLNLNLVKGAHDLSLSMRRSEQDYTATDSIDLNKNNLDFRYRYRLNNHTFGLEYNRFNRYPDAQDDTQAWHLGGTWRYDFDSGRKTASGYRAPASMMATTAGDLLDFVPNAQWSKTAALLKASMPSYITDDTNRTKAGLSLMPESELEQELILTNDTDRLAAAHLIFTLQDQSSSALQTEFAKLRNLMLKRYGLPDNSLEKELFNNQLRQKLQLGEFIRVYQWQLPGGQLRFGMPYRADGKVIFELQYAKRMGDLKNRDWGLQF